MNYLKSIYDVESVLDLRNILQTKGPSEIKKRFWARPPYLSPIILTNRDGFVTTNAICLESLIADWSNFGVIFNQIADQLLAAEDHLQKHRNPDGKFEWVCVKSDEVTPCNVDLNKGYWRFPLK